MGNFAGMGTKVQSESYLLGYPLMRNLNEDSSNRWSPYYGDRTLKEHLCNSFTRESVNEYSGHVKEMLKQTMLEHEATFRKQVYTRTSYAKWCRQGCFKECGHAFIVTIVSF